MARVRHPNIVQFLGYVSTPFVIVMELCPVGNLQNYWKSRRVSNSHKTRICIDVLRALAYLHNRKPSSIIHRDIKPTNVLMTESGVAKLTDFGLGRFFAHGDMIVHNDTGAGGSFNKGSFNKRKSSCAASGAALGHAPLPLQTAASDDSKSKESRTSRGGKRYSDLTGATAVVGTERYMVRAASHATR